MNLNVYVYLFFQEFIRVGYYVSNEYSDPELQETPPETPNFDKLTRNILASNPRVTKFKINWDDPSKVRKIDFIQYTLPFFWHLLIIINFPPYFFQPNENGETSENAANSNAMEENSNSSSTNSHSDENKPPAEKIVKSNVVELKAAKPLTKTEQPNEVNLKVTLLYLYTPKPRFSKARFSK